MIEAPSRRSFLFAGILIVVIVLLSTTLFSQMGLLSIRVDSALTGGDQVGEKIASDAIDGYTVDESTCLTGDDPIEDCPGTVLAEPDTTYLEITPEGEELVLPLDTPTIEENCAAVKTFHITHCGHVAPEQDYACRTTESQKVYEECLGGEENPDHSHSHEI